MEVAQHFPQAVEIRRTARVVAEEPEPAFAGEERERQVDEKCDAQEDCAQFNCIQFTCAQFAELQEGCAQLSCAQLSCRQLG